MPRTNYPAHFGDAIYVRHEDDRTMFRSPMTDQMNFYEVTNLNLQARGWIIILKKSIPKEYYDSKDNYSSGFWKWIEENCIERCPVGNSSMKVMGRILFLNYHAFFDAYPCDHLSQYESNPQAAIIGDKGL